MAVKKNPKKVAERTRKEREKRQRNGLYYSGLEGEGKKKRRSGSGRRIMAEVTDRRERGAKPNRVWLVNVA